ncbi:MAG: hypothetical protein OK441_01395 [Thaumarchaeota archaeon]|nr:hypothetical protein [Nitrososphaerota archaeon]
MKRRSKVAVVAVILAVAVIVFFVAPVVFWYTAYFPGITYPNVPHPLFSVYRSLSCVTVGFGVSFKSEGQQSAWYLTCNPPIVIPL